MNYYQMEQRIEEHMKQIHVPAVAVAVLNEQEILYARGFGTTSVEEGGTPVSPRTLFRIGSVTKPLTVTAVMRLVEDGQLDLDRPIKEYIEWLRFSEVHAEEQITLRMLLSHTAGLPSDSRSGTCDADDLERYVSEQIPQYPFIAPPGRLYSYANAGFSLAGYIAQAVSGKRFSDLMQQLIFDPLEMKHTTFDPGMVLTYPFALPHILHDGRLHVLHHTSYGHAIAPPGGAYSTVLDLANFAIMQLQHGRFHDRRLLSSSSVLQMQTQQTVRYVTGSTGYGLGFELMTYKGVPCIGHSGLMSTFGCQLMLLPEQKLAFVLMVSRVSYMKQVVSIILDALLNLSSVSARPATSEPERTLWEGYIGSFLGARAGLAVISIEDDCLILKLNNQRFSLRAHSTNVYFAYRSDSESPIVVGFIPEAVGSVRYMTIDGRPCERLESDPLFAPDPRLWIPFSGTYKEDDMDETITVWTEDDQLLLRMHDNTNSITEGICVPISETRFTWAGGLIEFQAAEDGTVPALTAVGVYTFRHL